ncbi:MAG: Lrp/AsnC family transcriptional regulator [Kordiimonadaceae bacterium]|nr:Lrp/AsnC family transcriptional regulator [Kordiimonadaceae bacterium]
MKKKKIDFIDLKILGALQVSGRVSKTQLSEDIGLSSTPCNERMRRLEDCGLIEGYHGDVNYELLDGYNFYWTSVNLKDYFSRSEEFEAFLMDLPEVFECFAILGQVDYMILIAARNVQEYQDILDQIISFDGQHVDFISHPVTRRIKKRAHSSLIKVVEKRYRDQN